MTDEATLSARRPAPPEDGFRALAEATPDSIVMGDAQGRIAYLNPAAERLFGRSAADVVGQPITILMPERLRAAHAGGFARFVATGRGRLVGRTIEVVAVRSDGREFPAELSLGSAGDGAGRTLTAVIRDLTERDRRERHLAAQLAVTSVLAGAHPVEETGQRLVEALTRALAWDIGLLWLRDDDGHLRVRHLWQADPVATEGVVRAARETALGPGEGLPGEALLAGRPVWHDDLAAAEAALGAAPALAAGLRAAICLPLVVDGAREGAVELLTREVLPVDDALRDLLMTVASQVGEHLGRRAAQARLDEERARSAAAFEHAPIGMALVAEDGAWLDVNPALCRITGRERQELLSLTFADITHPDDVDADTRLAARVLAGELEGYEMDKRYLRPGGEPVWVHLTVSVVRRGGTSTFVAQIQDITDARRAGEERERHAAELERSNGDLEHLAHVAAHDLRTPLVTISGFAELLERRHGTALPEDAREFVAMIRDSAQSGGHLLDNLLSYARAGGSGGGRGDVDLREVLDGVLVGLRAEVVRRDAVVEIGALPPVVADRVGVAQVLQNLVANAIKFTPQERRPRVRVTGEREGAWVRVDVADEGIGVAEGAAERLFSMFGRGAHGGRLEGAGIGLAVCARVVERHGGRIWVEPRAGGGSVFRFTLPAS